MCVCARDSTMAASLSSIEQFYTIVYDQQFSPSNKHLAACDSFGKISVFSLSSALSLSSSNSGKNPSKTVKAHHGPAYCLQSAGSMLVSGGGDDIKVWKWSHLTSQTKGSQPVLTLKPPAGKSGSTETNGLAYDKQASCLYGGCGDNSVHAWDMPTGKLKASYSGHTDYVHCVCMKSGSGQFISGGEDGTVRIWVRAIPVHTIKPEKHGEWIGCVATDRSGEWLVCGGGHSPRIYHLGSLSLTSTLAVPAGVVTQSAIFTSDRLITVGSEPMVRHWTLNGESLASVPSDHLHAFSVAYNTGNPHYQVLTVSGDSSNIPVFTNLGYKAFSLTL